MSRISPTKQKILLSLMAGLSIGLSYSPRKHFKIIKGLKKEWKKIDEEKLKQEIQALYRSKLVDLKEEEDGIFKMTLTDKGRLKVLKYHFQKMKIEKPDQWDGNWRMIIFDIPEKFRKRRDALRRKLKTLGFHELQRSVFVFPYPCRDEIDFLIEFFELRKYVRYAVLESIDNDLHLREIFDLV